MSLIYQRGNEHTSYWERHSEPGTKGWAFLLLLLNAALKMLTNSIIANEMYEKGGDQIFIIYQQHGCMVRKCERSTEKLLKLMRV